MPKHLDAMVQKRKKQKKLDFRLAGGNGTYLLQDLTNPNMNEKVQRLIEEADSTKDMTLEECPWGLRLS